MMKFMFFGKSKGLKKVDFTESKTNCIEYIPYNDRQSYPTSQQKYNVECQYHQP